MMPTEKFPETPEEFIRQNEDRTETWAKGLMLVPSFRVREMIERYFPKPMAPTEEIDDDNKPAAHNKILVIRYNDFLRYGCAVCGCGTVLQRGSVMGVGTCEECGQRQMFVAEDVKKIDAGFSDQYNPVMYHPEIQEHPRKGTPWHEYIWPDPRPIGGGEYWSPRGIGCDLSGFVKSKAAGERILEMTKELLGVDKPKSWLDWRESEPKWIQFKFQSEEFDLEKLYELAVKNNRVLTKSILRRCLI